MQNSNKARFQKVFVCLQTVFLLLLWGRERERGRGHWRIWKGNKIMRNTRENCNWMIGFITSWSTLVWNTEERDFWSHHPTWYSHSFRPNFNFSHLADWRSAHLQHHEGPWASSIIRRSHTPYSRITTWSWWLWKILFRVDMPH